MESKVTKYSAAAVIAMALTVILLGPGTSGNGGVVLADVQKNVDGIETMIVRGTKTFTRTEDPNNVFVFEGITCHFDLMKYFSSKYGLVEEGYEKGKLIYRITFNYPKRETLIVLPLWKKYVTFTSTYKQVQLLESMTPKGIVNLLMGENYKKLGREKIDGIETEVFEFKDPATFNELMPKAIFNIQSVKGKVWIGIDQQLPIKVEGDFAVGKSFMSMFQDMNLHEVNTLGQFNIELDESIFDVTPPEGYEQVTLADILALIPTKVKAGFVGFGILPVGLVCWNRRKKKERKYTNT